MKVKEMLPAKARSVVRRILGRPKAYAPSLRWAEMETRLASAETVVDLGCGQNPHPRATVGVDAFLEPIHRQVGQGPVIEPEELRAKGCEFVQADLSALPFEDKAFDFAYSHHVFEHLDDPKKACSEMMRVARGGVIVTPAPFAEIAFGRPYHNWHVFYRGTTIFFMRKLKEEDRLFGSHPEFINGRWKATSKTNPFDILLNEGNWYRGLERMPRLSRRLRELWFSRSPVIDTVFLWEGAFKCVVIQEDGTIE